MYELELQETCINKSNGNTIGRRRSTFVVDILRTKSVVHFYEVWNYRIVRKICI